MLKEGIEHVSDPCARGALLLAWSAALGKLNKTFLSARGRLESRGGSSIFSIYRYKLAATPVELSPWNIFRERVMNVIQGKAELLKQKRLWARTQGWRGSLEVHCLDIDDLPHAIGHKVDYIFTDPPYGGHIAYLDLSILWNHWLGFHVPLSAREKEVIVGGELRLTEDHYIKRLRKSIRVCVGMLKHNRWLSVVFQHWNVRYFEAILEEATEAGAGLQAAVTQIGDTVWSMHKKKNKEKVLAGEMILSFLKGGECRASTTKNTARATLEDVIRETLLQISPDGRPFAGELLFNQMVLNAWERGALRCLDMRGEHFVEALTKMGWHYNPIRHQWFSTRERVPAGLQLTF